MPASAFNAETQDPQAGTPQRSAQRRHFDAEARRKTRRKTRGTEGAGFAGSRRWRAEGAERAEWSELRSDGQGRALAWLPWWAMFQLGERVG